LAAAAIDKVREACGSQQPASIQVLFTKCDLLTDAERAAMQSVTDLCFSMQQPDKIRQFVLSRAISFIDDAARQQPSHDPMPAFAASTAAAR
jgi:hypothetical protein